MTIRLWDEAAAKNIPDADTRRLLQLLRAHVGKDQAIGMAGLYEQWSGERLPRDAGGKVEADVPTLSRHMRKLIDDLRDLYGVPVMSSAKCGYWIIATEAELEEVVHEFRSRGLKSLTTAARLKKISLADELQQIRMELDPPASTQQEGGSRVLTVSIKGDKGLVTTDWVRKQLAPVLDLPKADE